ncbi:hypothetical protein ACQPW3_11865 [Actinosynnema sp. CA-248983]
MAGPPTPERIATLGTGAVGESATADDMPTGFGPTPPNTHDWTARFPDD